MTSKESDLLFQHILNKDTFEKFQTDFIKKQMLKYNECQINSTHVDKIQVKDISISRLSMILKQNFINGTDMKAVLCLFETLFLATSQDKKHGIYALGTNIRQYISNFKYFNTDSFNGYIYMVDFFSPDINVVIKVEKKDSISMLREYFIGIKAINNLRYLIPTFSYTLGAFLCPPTGAAINQTSILCESGAGYTYFYKRNRVSVEKDNPKMNATEVTKELDRLWKELSDEDKEKWSNSAITPFVLYEKINGKGVDEHIEKLKMSFDQWLIIFFQLLLALEVAQREVRFTHFDLHCGNVMLRKNDSYSYNVSLDMNTYSIVKPEFIPVIIDFGMSSSYIDGKYIGSYDFFEHGMVNFMIPGYDMYKFMISTSQHTSEYFEKQMISLFRFYGTDDPYNIMTDPLGIGNAADEYCKNLTTSKAASYTPIMLANWLWKEYNYILGKCITIKERIEYLPIQYSSAIKQYDDIFNNTNQGIDKAVEIAEKCLSSNQSYVMTKYNIMVLEKYNKDLKSPKLDSKILVLNKGLSKFESVLVSNDMTKLEKVFDIKIPSQDDLDEITNLLTIKLNYFIPTIIKETKQIDNIFLYQKEITPYLQFYFTILELDLTDKFKIWIKKFKESDIYLFHITNVIQIERSIRWFYSITRINLPINPHINNPYINTPTPSPLHMMQPYISDEIKYTNINTSRAWYDLISMLWLLHMHPKECVVIPKGFLSDSGKIINAAFYRFSQTRLEWHYKSQSIVAPTGFWESVKNCLKKGSKFILIPMGIDCGDGNYSHANFLIYNTISKEMERFDPNGSYIDPNGSSTEIHCLNNNSTIKDEIIRLFDKHVQKDMITAFYEPIDFCPSKSFQFYQGIEGESTSSFCLAWSYWYADTRLRNPNKEREHVVDMALKSLYDNKSVSFTSYIRSFSAFLAKVGWEIEKSNDPAGVFKKYKLKYT